MIGASSAAVGVRSLGIAGFKRAAVELPNEKSFLRLV
jgi:hypothetical protein